MTPHPSRMALDQVALGLEDASVRAHASTCEACAAHLRRVEVTLPVPGWVEALPRPTRLAWRWLVPVPVMLTLALIVFALPKPSEITAKGLPEVQVWVHRGANTALWDGKPLHERDELRFELAPAGYSYLTIAQLEGSAPTVLHAGPLDASAVQLSPAWSVDGQAGDENVVVVLSKGPLSDEQLGAAIAGRTGWSTRFTFPKERP